jgi:hypothetical protein
MWVISSFSIFSGRGIFLHYYLIILYGGPLHSPAGLEVAGILLGNFLIGHSSSQQAVCLHYFNN